MERLIGGLFLVYLAGIVGWLANVWQIIAGLPTDWAGFTPYLILKIVGVFVPPLGAILGWVGFF